MSQFKKFDTSALEQLIVSCKKMKGAADATLVEPLNMLPLRASSSFNFIDVDNTNFKLGINVSRLQSEVDCIVSKAIRSCQRNPKYGATEPPHFLYWHFILRNSHS